MEGEVENNINGFKIGSKWRVRNGKVVELKLRGGVMIGEGEGEEVAYDDNGNSLKGDEWDLMSRIKLKAY